MSGISSLFLVAAKTLTAREILECRTFWGLVLAAVGLWLALPKRVAYGKTIGGVLGIVGLSLVASDWPLLPTLTDQAVFWLLASITIVAAVATITSYSPVYSAIWFALSLLGTGGLFFFNGAQFLGVATIVVYAGAIVVTFLFVIMLAQPEGQASYDRISWGWFAKTASVLVAAAIVGLMTMLLGGIKEQALAHAAAANEVTSSPRDAEGPIVTADKPFNPVLDHPHHMARLGAVLFSQHVISVELAGTLLLAALVGAVAIAAYGKRRLTTQVEDAMRLEEAPR
ncbi:MAG TPA: NADH-quinone oxidoreductase subunit J [Pirellulaceae bacterium]|nr:NADH-quinone oxidoreductase subunit J [Pirellulaceae bacterium]